MRVKEVFVIETLAEAAYEMGDPLRTEEKMVEIVDADGVEGDVEVRYGDEVCPFDWVVVDRTGQTVVEDHKRDEEEVHLDQEDKILVVPFEEVAFSVHKMPPFD